MSEQEKQLELDYPLLLGTYTSDEDDGSKGIYAVSPDKTTPYPVGTQPNPSYIIRHPEHKHLVYAVSESGDDPTSNIVVWHFETSDDSTEVLKAEEAAGTFSLKGEGACHLAIQGNLLVTANYGSGSADVVKLDDEGMPVRSVAHIQHEGTGPREDRQDAAHVHWAGFTADGTRLLLTDLGTDTVTAYSVEELEALAEADDAENNDLRAVQELKLPGGEGPRHIAVAPLNNGSGDGSDIYVLTELGHKIFHVKDDGKNMTIRDVYPLLDEEAEADHDNTAAAISLSPDGRTLLASDRGVDLLVTFRRTPETGTLDHASTVRSGSRVPREARILPDGKTVAAGHQDGSELVLFALDSETSELGGIMAKIPVSKVVCVLPFD